MKILILIKIISSIVTGTFFVSKVGIATTFSSKNDQWNPNPLLYCTNRVMRDNDLIVAHPYLPCGTKVLIYNPRTDKSVWSTVLDRGPRHALIDMSEGTTKAIKANGKEKVFLFYRVPTK